MKKVNFGKMFMAFAMMLAVGMFAACSSSDDNNNNKDTSGGGETPTPTATSGTLYMYAVVDPAGRVWADCTSTLSGTQSTKKFSTDSTTVDKLTNAKLVSAIKKSFETYNTLAKDLGPVLDETLPLVVDSVSLTSFPSSNTFKLNFSLKPDDEKGKELTCLIGYCFIDNLGNLSGIEGTGIQYATFDKEDDISGLINAMSDFATVTAKVSKAGSGFSLAVE